MIRTSNSNDIKQIADIKIRGWQQAYEGIVGRNYLNNMTLERQIDNYSNHYDLNNIVVAEKDNKIVGFCRFCFIQNSDIDCEIREIYVEPTLKRTGIGSMLFNYTKSYLKSIGNKKLAVGVFTDNRHARQFYEKMGGKISDNKIMVIDNVSYSVSTYLWDL